MTACPICLDTFDNPRSLPCLHTFCLQCIRGHCNSRSPRKNVKCPVCRKPFEIPSSGVVGLPHNFFIQGLLDSGGTGQSSPGRQPEEPCEVCLEDRSESAAGNVPPATRYCVDCDQKLCERCSAPHRRWRGGGHELKELGPELGRGRSTLSGSYCDKHKDKRVELYCFTCQKNICLLCSAVRHSDHERSEISELAVGLKSRIDADNRRIASLVDEIRSKAQQIRDARNKFLADAEKLCEDIREAGEAAKRMIDRQVRERLEELEAVAEEQAKTAVALEESLELELVAAQSFYQYSSQLVDSGRPSDVTAEAPQLHARAAELLRNDVTSASYSAPHVTFTPADVTDIKVDLVGQLHVFKVVDTLPEGEQVVGLTTLGDKFYVLRAKARDQIEAYDGANAYRLLHCTTVPGCRGVQDLTSCEHFLRLYVVDHVDECVHRLDVGGRRAAAAASRWPVDDEPCGISVNADRNVLVACNKARKVKELAADGGGLLRELLLPADVGDPWHAVQLTGGEFVVCHGLTEPVHRVCLVSADGRRVVRSQDGQYNVPIHLAVDAADGRVFVVDVCNQRVALLTATLAPVCDAASRDQFSWYPTRVCVDARRRLLYVADNEMDSDETRGSVVVFSIEHLS